jgi:hypothetical protein
VLGDLSWCLVNLPVSCHHLLQLSPLLDPQYLIYSYAQRQAFVRCPHRQKTLLPAVPWRPSLPRALCLPSPGKVLIQSQTHRAPQLLLSFFLLGSSYFPQGGAHQETYTFTVQGSYSTGYHCPSPLEELLLCGRAVGSLCPGRHSEEH